MVITISYNVFWSLLSCLSNYPDSWSYSHSARPPKWCPNLCKLHNCVPHLPTKQKQQLWWQNPSLSWSFSWWNGETSRNKNRKRSCPPPEPRVFGPGAGTFRSPNKPEAFEDLGGAKQCAQGVHEPVIFWGVRWVPLVIIPKSSILMRFSIGNQLFHRGSPSYHPF